MTQDPNATSAWNAVITGAKKWIMYPPDTMPPGVFTSEGNTKKKKNCPHVVYRVLLDQWTQ